uniref:G_PROTEIN_RECEP_F1_2 domain-containing protein n=1 Tax=Meloidogyne incognita TaxID=6306 RepID=A0A914MWJ9_MELIC
MNQTQCIAAEASVIDKEYNIVRVLHFIFGLIFIIMLVRIVWSYRTRSLKLHKNLILLLANILLLNTLLVLSYFLAVFMNFIVLYTYNNSCDCLIQIWVVYLIRIPFYLQIAGSPLFHFAIMIERILATVYVKIYENQGKKIGVISTIIVWIFTLMFGFYVYITSSMDVNTFSHPMVYLTLTSIYNSQLLIDIHSFFLILVICIAIADYYLINRNKKIKSNFSITTYSLSQSYQTKQNILVMKIIFPLDFSYTFVYALFNILSTFIRSKRSEYGQLVYVRTYDGIIL